MTIKANNYDGYVEIITRIKDIVNGEPLNDVEKDSLITKIDTFQNEICEFVVQKEEWNNTLMRVYQSRKYE